MSMKIGVCPYFIESQKKIIKRYEKVTPGELAHIDLTKVPKDIRTVFKAKNLYVAALEDDCTRLTYLEILKDKKASTLTYFMARPYPGSNRSIILNLRRYYLIMVRNLKAPWIENIPSR
jgi:hypothetical protein